MRARPVRKMSLFFAFRTIHFSGFSLFPLHTISTTTTTVVITTWRYGTYTQGPVSTPLNFIFVSFNWACRRDIYRTNVVRCRLNRYVIAHTVGRACKSVLELFLSRVSVSVRLQAINLPGCRLVIIIIVRQLVPISALKKLEEKKTSLLT